MNDSKRPIRLESIRLGAGRASAAARLLCGWLMLCSGGAFAEPAARVPEPAAMGGTQPDQASPWLDEVRAQREAWEARRSAVREQHEQRRRLHHPRGAAQQESWEADLRRRRAERQERIDQDREVFRRLGPEAWGPPRPFSEDASEVSGRSEPLLPEPPPVSPPGWDNLWYFRGY